MLCNTCKNKYICKHCEYFKSIEINIRIRVDECELYSSANSNNAIQTPFHNPDKRPAFRQPLPSRGIDDDKEEEILEDEEKVFVNIDDCTEPQNISIVDMFMKGDKNND
jgi:CRISPR/Cas system CSM-associated protein Csm3 (group 7 of RAMP superfamily)